jgi:hypothetical protein
VVRFEKTARLLTFTQFELAVPSFYVTKARGTQSGCIIS